MKISWAPASVSVRTIQTGMLVAILFVAASSVSANAETAAMPATAACGSPNVKFKVSTADASAPAPAAEGQQALFYFIEDDKHFASVPKPTTREAVDGNWVGAMHGDSYFAVSVAPGEHHLCANWQRGVVLFQGKQQSVLHVTAESGQKYFFRVASSWRSGDAADLQLEPLDSDEAQLLIAKRRVSTFGR